MRSLYLLTALLVLSGCASSRSAAEAEPDGGPASPPPQNVTLQEVSRTAREPAQPLGGPNKPNGIDYRYRRWVPAETPAFVPRQLDSLELVLVDQGAEGWLTMYQSPLGEMGPNQTYRAILFDPSGELVWELDLNQFFSRPDQLEIQDMRYEDGSLYFNEACQTYAREADGACSSLVKLDPYTREVQWRTRYLISNDIFILHGPYVIAGYGFTAEPDFLHLIDRQTGQIVSREPLDSAHDYFEVENGMLRVVTYNSVYRFTLPDG